MSSSPSRDLFTVTLELPTALEERAVTLIGQCLWDKALATTTLRPEGKKSPHWRVQWILQETPDLSLLKIRFALLQEQAALGDFALTEDRLKIEKLADINWLEYSYQQFQPFTVGRFYIHGSHYKGEIPEDLIVLNIDAATAFGSGEHGTTAGCLEAMLQLYDQGFEPKRILDMGTGSGILAVAARKLWQVPVLAVDIDQEAVDLAMHHRDINAVPAGPEGMRCLKGDGFDTPVVQDESPYDLIIANILAGPLRGMAPALCRASAPGGYVILSGILIEQAQDVLPAYKACGMVSAGYLDREEWRTIILQNPTLPEA